MAREPEITALENLGTEDIRTKFGRSREGIGDALLVLKKLRKQLENEEISVAEFQRLGQPIAEQAIGDIGVIAGQSGKAASSVNPFISEIKKTGFVQTGGAGETPEVQLRLPENLELQSRDVLLQDPNLSPEEKRRLLETIPSDVRIGSDRFAIEKERVRQELRAEQEQLQRQQEREGQLTELEKILATQRKEAFAEGVPILSEQLQTQGLLQTSELERQFGKEEARLARESQNILATERLKARELDLGEKLDIQEASRRFQSAGLQREFSLSDFQREEQIARQIAELSKPQQRGKGKGEKALGVIQGVQGAANTASSIRTAITG